jgi:hypothetical protein
MWFTAQTQAKTLDLSCCKAIVLDEVDVLLGKALTLWILENLNSVAIPKS